VVIRFTPHRALANWRKKKINPYKWAHLINKDKCGKSFRMGARKTEMLKDKSAAKRKIMVGAA
jgi:hypothetical protein